MSDQTEAIRRRLVSDINGNPNARETLELLHGKDNVWDSEEIGQTFEVVGFMAPFCVVRRLSDGVRGTVMFQHRPRFYFGFQEEGK